MNQRFQTVVNSSHSFQSYESFLTFLRTTSGWHGPEEPPYDAIGMFHAFAALLDNLRENSNPAEQETFRELLSEEQRQFLRQLSEAL